MTQCYGIAKPGDEYCTYPYCKCADKVNNAMFKEDYRFARMEHAGLLRCEGLKLREIAVRLDVKTESARQKVRWFGRRLQWATRRTKWSWKHDSTETPTNT